MSITTDLGYSVRSAVIFVSERRTRSVLNVITDYTPHNLLDIQMPV